jgi:hypothetical protein
MARTGQRSAALGCETLVAGGKAAILMEHGPNGNWISEHFADMPARSFRVHG